MLEGFGGDLLAGRAKRRDTSADPVWLVEPPHKEQEEPRPLTPEQAARLLAVARGHEFEQLYMVMLATGLRIREALGLRWFDVDHAELGGADTETKQLHVRQQITIIPGQPWRLTPPKSKSGPIFCDELGQPIVGRRSERVFKQHLGRAGLPTEFALGASPGGLRWPGNSPADVRGCAGISAGCSDNRSQG